LFGGGFFSTTGWYETVVRAALPDGAAAAFVVVEDDGGVAAVFPMQRRGRVLSGLTTPYTCLWQVLWARHADHAAVGGGFAALCRGRPVRLDALDLGAPGWAGFVGGLRRGGVRALTFDHFGNWIFPDAGVGWETYLAGRPGALREAVRRRTRKLMQAGADFRVVDGAAGLEGGIASYEAMHAKSWKSAEPFPEFNAALMRRCAKDGSLRLGVLSLDGAVLAAQFWVVFGDTATMLKIAHDAAADAWSPGTVLTGLMIRHVMAHDAVRCLDFGRGDDGYKALWMSERRQRRGVMLVNPFAMRGGWEISRRAAGNAVQAGRRWWGQ
jgi:hypothetical protein